MSRHLKILLTSDSKGVRGMMTLLSNWLNSDSDKRKVMYIEQRLEEPFIIPDEDPMGREAELHRAFNHGFRASSGMGVYQEDIDNAWLQNKKSLL